MQVPNENLREPTKRSDLSASPITLLKPYYMKSLLSDHYREQMLVFRPSSNELVQDHLIVVHSGQPSMSFHSSVMAVELHSSA
jgi:hypothetical protein